MNPIINKVKELLSDNLTALEGHFNADFLTYYGPIVDGNENFFLKILEDLANDPVKKDKLFIILTTGGGSAIAVERYVNIIRHHYNEVSFIVPDYAYSAGTIFCMSGDNIFMDYFSVLGPIDPQVQNKEGKWVAALGYLDKVNEMIEKARNHQLTDAEFLILKDIDLAELKEYEQAKALTIDLLKKWLVKYKFKNWEKHNTTPSLKGQKVTLPEKQKRAEEIAEQLSNNGQWKSHGRPINIETLTSDLKLKIEDYSNMKEERELIRAYYDLLVDFVRNNNLSIFLHTRKFI
jgi:membrane-bound ClpP family serine protease